MKKGKKLIAMMLVMVVTSLTICSMPVEAKELTAKQIMKKAAATSSEIKNYTSKTDFVIAMKCKGKSYTTKVEQKMSYKKSPFRVKADVILEAAGKREKQTSYYVKKGRRVYSYAKRNNTWERSALDTQNSKKLINSDPGAVMKDNMRYLTNFKIKSKNAKVSGRKAYVITANISTNNLSQTENTKVTNVSQLKGRKVQMTYWVDKETYYPLKCSIDMKKTYQNFMKEFSGSKDIKVTKCNITVTYSKINKTPSFKLPYGVK